MEVSYKTSDGFLKDAAYTADLYVLLKSYENQFENQLDELNLELEELSYFQISRTKREPIKFSQDGKSCKIHLTFHKYYDNKGKVTGVPSPFDVYQTIKFVLKKAVEEFNKNIKNA